uniref:Uncharacterized protein n=1 Tax=Picea glauca TaxID=3330 RepID=A0A117NHE1_PICGL|nr:hypothetical protein ABT39_MTgene5228 [Picea glauca]QHR89160.1 hypothetical protein Q903MT_gene3180 [Picea sitchensis]
MRKSGCLPGSISRNPLFFLHTWSGYSRGVTSLPLELDLVTMDLESRFAGKWVPSGVLYGGVAYKRTSLVLFKIQIQQ